MKYLSSVWQWMRPPPDATNTLHWRRICANNWWQICRHFIRGMWRTWIGQETFDRHAFCPFVCLLGHSESQLGFTKETELLILCPTCNDYRLGWIIQLKRREWVIQRLNLLPNKAEDRTKQIFFPESSFFLLSSSHLKAERMSSSSIVD